MLGARRTLRPRLLRAPAAAHLWCGLMRSRASSSPNPASPPLVPANSPRRAWPEAQRGPVSAGRARFCVAAQRSTACTWCQHPPQQLLPSRLPRCMSPPAPCPLPPAPRTKVFELGTLLPVPARLVRCQAGKEAFNRGALRPRQRRHRARGLGRGDGRLADGSRGGRPCRGDGCD